ncbi:MAG TPA: CHAD domain-containing protein [Gaiellaceae bacterium]
MSRVFRSTYHDTADRRLARHGVALRRRLENGKSTWEVELPEAPRRVALAAPGGPAEPPRLIADLLQTIIREGRLVEILTVQTRRSDELHDQVSRLENGSVVAEFVRDGREDDPGLDVLEPPPVVSLPKKASARERVQARLREQYHEILARDPGTRLGEEPEAVHKFRVAVRRSRSVLRSARPMLDRVWAEQLRAELDWLGTALGRVRDLDVLLLELRREVETLAAEDRAGAERLLAELGDEREAARRELGAALTSGRYLNLIARVEEAVQEPRWVGKEQPVEKLARKEFRKLKRAVAALSDDPSDEALHRARVKAKRARYAAELAKPVCGKRARRFVKRAREYQDLVGEHQDAVVAEQKLRQLPGTRGEPALAFVAGRLAERQQERRVRARRQVPRAWKRLERAGRKAWR